MTSTLPRRPYAVLPPPDDGLARVRQEAGRRRRRKLAAAGGGAGALAVAAAVVLSTSGGGLAVLRPTPPAAPGFVQPTPSTTPTGGHAVAVGPATVRPADGGRPVRGRKAGRAPAPSDGHAGGMVPNATDATQPPAGEASRPQQPALTRWQSTYTESPARQCSGSTYGDGNGGLESSVGWCLDVMATALSDGVRLQIQLCRDSTGGGTLSFAGSREVDLAVQQGTRTVWDWAELHPGGSGAHQLSAKANGCWNWSVVWPDVAQDGSAAGHGTFTFVGTSTADDMKGKPSESATFSY